MHGRPSVVTWINPNGGDWDNPRNWDTGKVPRKNQDVVIALPGVTVSHSSRAHDSVRSLSSVGTLEIAGGSLSVTGDALAHDLTLDGGTLTTGGTFRVDDLFRWTGGTLDGSGPLEALSRLTISGPDPKTLGGALDNATDGTWSGGDIAATDSGVIRNLTGATFQVDAGGTLDAPFDNAGTFLLGGDAVTAQVGKFTNSGSVSLQGGTLEATAYEQMAGTTDLGGGVLSSSDPVLIEGGKLLGGGSIAADLVNSGEVDPGAASTLLVQGNYTQNDQGVLTIHLSGGAASPFSQLDISGQAALGGSLNVQTPVGFTPQPGDTYQVMQFAGRTGEFAAVAGLSRDVPPSLTAVYHPQDLTLVVGNLPIPPTSGDSKPPPDQGSSQGQETGHGTDSPRSVGENTRTSDRTTADTPVLSRPVAVDVHAAPDPIPGGGGQAVLVQPHGLVIQPPSPPLVAAAAVLPRGFDLFSALLVGPVPASSLSGTAQLGGGGSATSDRSAPASERGNELKETADKHRDAATTSAVRAGASSEEPDGGADELFEALALAPPEPDLPAEEELLSPGDIAGSLLVGGRPRADLLHQRGSPVAPVATLLAGADEGGTVRPAGVEDEVPLKGLLINPVAGPVRGPAVPGPTKPPAAARPVHATHPTAFRHNARLVLLVAALCLGGLTQAAGTIGPRDQTGPRRGGRGKKRGKSGRR